MCVPECETKARAKRMFPIPADISPYEVAHIAECLPDFAYTPWPTCLEVNRVRHESSVAPMTVCGVCAEVQVDAAQD